MHVTTKETDENGAHILTSVVEADGAAVLCSENAQLIAKVISVARTPSGGYELKSSVQIIEPTEATAPVPLTPEQEALAYLAGKDFPQATAQAQLDRFGATRILAQRDKEAAQKQADLDRELADVLAGKPEPEPTPSAVN